MTRNMYTQQKITDTLEKNYMPYAMSVIVSRAIPEIDGFKPAHRKLLYTMYKMNLIKGSKTKSANIVGQTMKLNPHGDGAIYETMVRLTKGYDALLHPFVDSKGNFGKHSSRDMKYAAARYTEAKLSELSEEVFKDIEKNTVEFVDNYDGKLKEPTLLPTTFPNVLVNPNKGIAVGMASNICSFNLSEVCNATIKYLKDEKADLFEEIKGPDFSTGGYYLKDDAIMKKVYETGQGSFKVRAKYRYMKKENCIEVYEIPYTSTVEQIIDKIVDLVKANKLREISDIRDEMDLKGLKITIDLKRGTDPEMLMRKLYKMTPLEDSFSCNFNILIDGSPRVLGIGEIIKEWCNFRINCKKRQLNFDANKKSEKLHLLKGLEKVLLDIDKAVKIIRETKNDKEVIPNIMSHFDIDKVQAEFASDIKLRNLNEDYILNKTSEIGSLNADLEEIESILQSDKKIKSIIIKELKSVVKKYGTNRRTEILESYKEGISEDEIVKDYDVNIFITEHGYIKKITDQSLRMQNEHRLKEDDDIVFEIKTRNKSEMLFFTDKANVYKKEVSEIEDSKASALGKYIPNILEMEENENIIYSVNTKENYKGYMIFVFENGKVAKVPLQSYKTKTKRKRLIKSFDTSERLIGLKYIEEAQDIMLMRDKDVNDARISLLSTDLVPEKATKNTKGVQVVRMKKGSVLFKMLDTSLPFEELEHYRVNKIPSTGKEMTSKDKRKYNKIVK